MKKTYLIIALITLLTAPSCKKDAYETDYSNSRSAWLAFKNQVHNSYSYTNTYGSVFGFGGETTTIVTNGVITGRNYTAYRQTGPTGTITKQWHEDAATLNTHGTEAGELLTLDQVYEKAKNVWLKADPKTNTIYFESNNNGLISSCGFVPKGCQDDCFNGITIKTIVAL